MDDAQPALSAISQTHNLARLTAQLAQAAAVTVLLMFAIFLTTGIGQDPLQFVHSQEEYATILLKNPAMLKAAVGLDNLFIVLYSSMFLALFSLLKPSARNMTLLSAALALLMLSGLLDLLENMHFLTMIAAAVQSLPVELAEIKLQAWESLVKFHASYLGLFLLGLSMPRQTMLEKALCIAFCWIQLPVGLLIYLTPAAVAKPLVMLRFMFFLGGLLGLAAVCRRRYGLNAPR